MVSAQPREGLETEINRVISQPCLQDGAQIKTLDTVAWWASLVVPQAGQQVLQVGPWTTACVAALLAPSLLPKPHCWVSQASGPSAVKQGGCADSK